MNEKSRKPVIVSIIGGIVLIAAVIYWYVGSVSHPTLASYSVQNGQVSEQIQATGVVQAAQNVDLAFQKAGTIVAVDAQVGDQVSAGQVLAELDSSDIQAELVQANANVTAQQATLQGLQQGARPQQIQIQQTTIQAAQTSLSQAQQALVTAIDTSYQDADNAIHNEADTLFNNPRSSNPTLTIPVNDSSLQQSIQSERLSLEGTLTSWNTSLMTLSATSSADAINAANTTAENDLTTVNNFLNDLSTAVNSLTPSSNIPQATIDGYKASIAGVRATISGQISALNGADSAYQGDQSALTLAQNQLTLEQAGGQATAVNAQQAVVDQAVASVQNLQAQLAYDVIRSPFAGQVTVQNAKVGQTSVPGQAVISLNSDSQFQIQSYVPEDDVAKIAVGNPATITLDAYGNSVLFPATVVAIDPAETMTGNVASYKVTLQFNNNDSRIKSGMTANISITSASSSTTTVTATSTSMVIPMQSVITENNQTYVLAKKAGTNNYQLEQVQIGAEGSDGMVQVLSGLSDGDQVANFGSATTSSVGVGQ